MNIDNIKMDVASYLGQQKNFVYKSGRGQDEKFNGKVEKLFSRVFTVRDDSGVIHSFSYSDFAIKNIKII